MKKIKTLPQLIAICSITMGITGCGEKRGGDLSSITSGNISKLMSTDGQKSNWSSSS